MFDIGLSELLLVLIIGLVVLGPERLPVAVRTVAGWIRTLRSMVALVQNQLDQELKLQELQDSLKTAKETGLNNLSAEIKANLHDPILNDAELYRSAATSPSIAEHLADPPAVTAEKHVVAETIAQPQVSSGSKPTEHSAAVIDSQTEVKPACSFQSTGKR